MFDLVADVERYPEFVPLCRDLKVRQRTPQGEGVEIVVADMTVAYKLIRETFTQPRHARPAEAADPGRISRRAVQPSGEPLDASRRRARQACEVEFFIDYEFRSRTLGLLMGAMFDAAFRRFAAAFERRADEVYGRARRPSSSALAGSPVPTASRAPPAPSAGAPRRGRCRRTAARGGCSRPPRAAAAKCTSPTGFAGDAAARPGDAGDRRPRDRPARAPARPSPSPRRSRG